MAQAEEEGGQAEMSAPGAEASPRQWPSAAPNLTSSFSANLGMMTRRSANLHVRTPWLSYSPLLGRCIPSF
jgi:hypothetical protein